MCANKLGPKFKATLHSIVIINYLIINNRNHAAFSQSYDAVNFLAQL